MRGVTPGRVRSSAVSGWNFADVYEVVAEQVPDALWSSARRSPTDLGEVDRRADGIAKVLLENGAQRQDKLAHYLYNGPEYMETTFATFKAGLAPVNTNYRYARTSSSTCWDNADAVAVVFHGCFSERVSRVRDRVDKVQTWLWGRRRDRAVPGLRDPVRGSGRVRE